MESGSIINALRIARTGTGGNPRKCPVPGENPGRSLNYKDKMEGKTGFSYVNIVGDKYKGWLNLFYGEYCIAMIEYPDLADKIREEIPEKHEKTEEK